MLLKSYVTSVTKFVENNYKCTMIFDNFFIGNIFIDKVSELKINTLKNMNEATIIHYSKNLDKL